MNQSFLRHYQLLSTYFFSYVCFFAIAFFFYALLSYVFFFSYHWAYQHLFISVIIYFTSVTLSLTWSTKTFEGLNAGM
jgi:hypothetical protein